MSLFRGVHQTLPLTCLKPRVNDQLLERLKRVDHLIGDDLDIGVIVHLMDINGSPAGARLCAHVFATPFAAPMSSRFDMSADVVVKVVGDYKVLLRHPNHLLVHQPLRFRCTAVPKQV